MRFADYVVASVGMLPGTLLYVYYGKLAGDVAALAGGAAPEKGAGYYAVLILGLVATDRGHHARHAHRAARLEGGDR